MMPNQIAPPRQSIKAARVTIVKFILGFDHRMVRRPSGLQVNIPFNANG